LSKVAATNTLIHTSSYLPTIYFQRQFSESQRPSIPQENQRVPRQNSFQQALAPKIFPTGPIQYLSIEWDYHPHALSKEDLLSLLLVSPKKLHRAASHRATPHRVRWIAEFETPLEYANLIKKRSVFGFQLLMKKLDEETFSRLDNPLNFIPPDKRISCVLFANFDPEIVLSEINFIKTNYKIASDRWLYFPFAFTIYEKTEFRIPNKFYCVEFTDQLEAQRAILELHNKELANRKLLKAFHLE